MIDEPRFSKDGLTQINVRVVNPACKLAKDLYSELKDSLHAMGLTGTSKDKVSEVVKHTKVGPEPGTLDFARKLKAEESAPEVLEIEQELFEEEEKENADTGSNPEP